MPGSSLFNGLRRPPGPKLSSPFFSPLWPGRAERAGHGDEGKIARFLIFASKIRFSLKRAERARPDAPPPLTPLLTLALAGGGAFGGRAFQFAALAPGGEALGGGLLAMGLGMGAEIPPRRLL